MGKRGFLSQTQWLKLRNPLFSAVGAWSSRSSATRQTRKARRPNRDFNRFNSVPSQAIQCREAVRGATHLTNRVRPGLDDFRVFESELVVDAMRLKPSSRRAQNYSKDNRAVITLREWYDASVLRGRPLGCHGPRYGGFQRGDFHPCHLQAEAEGTSRWSPIRE